MSNNDGPPNPLEEYFLANEGRLIWKWMHYFDIYHQHFASYRDKPVTILEIGVLHGGSLQMWKHYFGKSARIIGIDIDPLCQDLEEEQIEIIIGDQGDRTFLRALREQVGPIDVLIEDGGHQMIQQIVTFEEMFAAVKENGVYLVEDLHTSYWREFGGGYRQPGTFIEFAKRLMDDLHARYSRDEAELKETYYTENIKGMHIYDSVIVFEKGFVPPPDQRQTGRPSF